ncbi:hypothetical protein EIN_222950 [Entamoeba invadens IP1]|uniref:EF-hand domain-containing protein n=1 Tax=Entamoeba invadens IP1 TaxID=370355 RepID=A0A0A1U240_ENTIV|nr:hypothetical protein EIN_222950 [Entamoeba invadens IP1]ELP88122.1 hypothetical protein EIN_222950 [Entamoeba invadens IP1]|eukprot:XP_004254893.1 hypothetical protein EIN_222950 [Entamoeba invadens IP1]
MEKKINDEEFGILSQGNSYLSIQATVSAISNLIYSQSKIESPTGPSRKEMLSSYYNSVITSLYVPLFATATDTDANGKVTQEELDRTLSILNTSHIDLNSDTVLANTILFEILDTDNDGKVPTNDIIHFVVKISGKTPSSQATEGVRNLVDPLNTSFVTLDNFVKAMNQ